MPCTERGLPREVAVQNVIATLRGTADPERIYVIGGHYDSRNTSTGDGKDYSRIVRLCLLTGCRREEIGGLWWDEIQDHRIHSRDVHESIVLGKVG